MNIRDAIKDDAQHIADIYNYYIANTIVTFEEDLVADSDIAIRINETEEQNLPWIVAEKNRDVVGYAYASKWKGRCAYRYSVEVTVYLAPDAGGNGTGSRLYDVLFARLKALGYHVVIGGISLPNPASIALHEKFGMTKVGEFKQVGFKFRDWVDVGYWQGVIGD